MLVIASIIALSGIGCHTILDGRESSAAERAAAVDLSLPFDAYELTGEARSRYDRALDLLARACMNNAGFDWYVPPQPNPGFDVKRRRYGVIDPDVAERIGYHLPVSAQSQLTLRKRNEILKNPRAADKFFGTNKAGNSGGSGRPADDGCAMWAYHRLERSVGKTDEQLLIRLDRASLDAAKNQPSVQAVNKSWQTCMRSRGLSYASPDDAIADKAWKLNTPTVSAKEREVATADVICKYQVDMVDVARRAEVMIQQKNIAENRTELELLRQATQARERNVAAVLESLER
ncbi:hypothetical protein GCM10022224_056310 [Nonomuraea antimicrobica]|uniref:DUF732 domain-containing protein n=2 Tax=Nonomuraea antimicrobica TaxID=561173 RepID=A0ABP7CDJ5_9ACTN